LVLREGARAAKAKRVPPRVLDGRVGPTVPHSSQGIRRRC
jgi:hypothetical protein